MAEQLHASRAVFKTGFRKNSNDSTIQSRAVIRPAPFVEDQWLRGVVW